MPTKEISIADAIAEKIKVRYAHISHKTHGSQNMVVDSFYPTYVYEQLKATQHYPQPKLSSRVSAINPFIARELNAFQIPTEDLVRMLGYKKADIKQLLNDVKAKNKSIVLVGLGGSGANFLYFTNELCQLVNTQNIFKNLHGYDNDEIDLTNVFRLPLNFDVKTFNVNVLKNSFYKTTICEAQNFKIASKQMFSTNLLYVYHANNYMNSEGDYPGDWIFYGAPDIKARIWLKYFPFISATHGDNDCQLYCRPEQDLDLQVESYGMINLSVFFMNQLKMVIQFLSLIAAGEDFSESKMLLEYSFAKEYKEGRISCSGCNRTYNFPMLDSMQVHDDANPQQIITEEELQEEEPTQLPDSDPRILEPNPF